MNIVHWNICGAEKNKDAIIRVIRDFKLQILLLNETLLKPNTNFKISGFSSVRADKPNGADGIAIFLKNKIKYNIIDLSRINIPERCQVILVELVDFFICCVYNPPDICLVRASLDSIFDLTRNKPVLVMGDFNAHNPIWGSQVSYSRGIRSGNILYDFIKDHDLWVLNDGSATRLTRPGVHSAPDVAFCSQRLSGLTDCRVLQDRVNSDHFPILCIIGNNRCNSGSTRNYTSKYNFNKADWEKFSDLISTKFRTSPPINYEDFMNIIFLSIAESVPMHKHSLNYGLPWWDNECTNAIKRKRQAFRDYKNNPSETNFLESLRTRAQTRQLLRKKKKEGFVNFCENLSPNTSAKEVWSSIRRFAKGRKSKSPGVDKVPFSVLSHLPVEGAVFLIKFFNKILRRETTIPETWKTQMVIAIPKPGRDPSALSSYRPINLASCISKTFEIMIKNRLEWFVENQGLIDVRQTGFRKGKGTFDNLAVISSEVLCRLARNQLAAMVTLDISNAYDNINVDLLTSVLAKIGIARDLTLLIKDFLTNRKIQVKDPSTNTFVSGRTTSKGVPQGSPLSPLLFNIYINSINETIPENIRLLQFADDTALLSTGTDAETIVNNLNRTLQNIHIWSLNVGLEINPNKSAAIFFSRKNYKVNYLPRLHLNTRTIAWTNSITYLGVIFDPKLSWEPQIRNMIQKASGGLNMMRFISRIWWGAHPSTLLTFYKAYVRPHLDYGASFLGGSSRKSIAQLNKIQFEALRIALGYMKSTPTNILLGEASEMDLEHRRYMLATKSLLKAASLVDSETLAAVRWLYITYNENYYFFRKKSIPALVDAFERVDSLLDTLYRSPVYPCFSCPLPNLLSSVQIQDLKLKKDNNNSKLFEIKKSETWTPDFHLIFTDASKDKEGRVGFGVYNYNTNLKMGQGLPSELSICSAEIYAIGQALDWIEFKDINKAVILSDSKSALEDINKTGMDAKSNYLTLQVKNKLFTLIKTQNKDIQLCWIPSHTSIKENDIADQIANAARLEPQENIKLSFREFFPKLKHNIWNAWSDRWKHIGLGKGVNFTSHYSTPPTKPWFHKLDLNRREITTMCRLRSNHCCSPAHLNRIKVKLSGDCECGELGDLSHVLFDCALHWEKSQQLYESLISANFPSPLHINSILFHRTQLDFAARIVCRFLDACGLKL
ncbi:RNA-directed DNA polymerase from mobile element jockey isoform X2 [Cylas formicarius]|uniref:RNA-directed DNA polymerase from mobile element jockey isoform X2 n=1 Tax=Cylas formicarius TaxID=197179 RepID=UPI002958409B|nr:RNA-directed DNA polymerase from mobile element jockey isoform X2 [Cylas formicarius]